MSDRLRGLLEQAQELTGRKHTVSVPSENLPFGIDERVLEFFVNNPLPKDKDYHRFAAGIKVAPDEAETNAYILATIGAMFVAGGRANREGVTRQDADPEELKKGIEVEAEHTFGDDKVCRFIQERISLDHFAEAGKEKAGDSTYYTKLRDMEKEIEKEML